MSNVRDFGARGDGKTDDTRALVHAVADGDGFLEFPPGVYRITRTIDILLQKHGPLGIQGSAGTAKIVMDGAGPAFRLMGTHNGTGDPATQNPSVIRRERLPTITNLEIEGKHALADGIEMIGTMQAVFEGLLIHRVRHGVWLRERNRNVLISHCHIYYNSGVGVLLDKVNLHQINIIGNHISYNRLGGIRIVGSEIRNLQITGNDIEYNTHHAHQTPPEPTAEIHIDTTEEGASVNEVAVTSNTIQAKVSPGGANIRIVDKPGKARPPGLWTITGNIIGSQENNVHLTGCHGVVLSGNCIYSAMQSNLLIEKSDQINITGNNFRRHSPDRHTGLRLIDSHDCLISGCAVQDESAEGQASGHSLLELVRCQRINVNGCQFLDGVPYGVDATQSSQVLLSGCTMADSRAVTKSQAGVRFQGAGKGNLLANNLIGKALEKPLKLDPAANVQEANNVVDS